LLAGGLIILLLLKFAKQYKNFKIFCILKT
jgi:hypothetical protein